jgi:CheY-like chemotaxis protein
MKILIVEDNTQVRDVIRTVVLDLAEEIRECGDGSQALEAYAAYRPDWVLMDIKMIEMDGLEATRRIKAHFPEARIMIVTNYDDADSREAARQAGACEYVLKENLLDAASIIAGKTTAGR